MKLMERSRKSERTLTSYMYRMRQTLGHLEPMCDVRGMSVTTAKQRLTTKIVTLRAFSRVPRVF